MVKFILDWKVWWHMRTICNSGSA